MLAVMDETTPEDTRGVFYVVGAAILTEEPSAAAAALRGVIAHAGRTRPFHWSREGSETRWGMVTRLAEVGAVAHVCVHHPTGRRKLEAARFRGIQEVVPCLVDDGVSELLIESRGGPEVDQRDRAAIVGALKGMPDPPPSFTYQWKDKEEPLLWAARCCLRGCAPVSDRRGRILRRGASSPGRHR